MTKMALANFGGYAFKMPAGKFILAKVFRFQGAHVEVADYLIPIDRIKYIRHNGENRYEVTTDDYKCTCYFPEGSEIKAKALSEDDGNGGDRINKV